LGSWFDAVPGERFDLIAANPPYIAADDPALLRLAAEPRLALTCGPTGLEALEHIALHAPAHLKPGGWLVVEHGSTQAAAVAALLERQGFHLVRSEADLAGHARVTLGARTVDALNLSPPISHEGTP
jgi:release factor glutamine methyltransferase